MPISRPAPARDAIASLEALASTLAQLEPELERWLLVTADGSAHRASERERALRAARGLRLQASRITAVLEDALDAATPASWQGQERRGPNRARNVERLPMRPAEPDQGHSPRHGEDWESF